MRHKNFGWDVHHGNSLCLNKEKRSRISWIVVSRGIRRVYLVAYSPLTWVHLIPIYRNLGNENYSASTGVVYTKLLTWHWKGNITRRQRYYSNVLYARIRKFPSHSKKEEKRVVWGVEKNTGNYRYIFVCFLFFMCYNFLLLSLSERKVSLCSFLRFNAVWYFCQSETRRL